MISFAQGGGRGPTRPKDYTDPLNIFYLGIQSLWRGLWCASGINIGLCLGPVHRHCRSLHGSTIAEQLSSQQIQCKTLRKVGYQEGDPGSFFRRGRQRNAERGRISDQASGREWYFTIAVAAAVAEPFWLFHYLIIVRQHVTIAKCSLFILQPSFANPRLGRLRRNQLRFPPAWSINFYLELDIRIAKCLQRALDEQC